MVNSFLLNDSFLGPIILFFTFACLAVFFTFHFLKTSDVSGASIVRSGVD